MNRFLRDVVAAVKPVQRDRDRRVHAARRAGIESHRHLEPERAWRVTADNGMNGEELAADPARDARARARAASAVGGRIGGRSPLPDLMPLVHARDAAEAKVAAIGTVNPRRGGPLNALVQVVKRTVARALDWHVREQVEFNREVMACVDATLEALNSVNRTLADLANRIEPLREEAQATERHPRALERVAAGWERKLAHNEMQFLRSVADLQAAFQHRVTLMEANFRDIAKSQHTAFEGALDRARSTCRSGCGPTWSGSAREYERLIHTELRLVRQRALGARAAARLRHRQYRQARRKAGCSSTTPDSPSASADRKNTSAVQQRFYVPFFQGCRERAGHRLRAR